MIGELVGLDCVEQYCPHQVAMQFRIDQDVLACVAQANKTASIVWSKYINQLVVQIFMFHPSCLRLMLQLVTRSGGSNQCRVCNVQERVFCDQKDFQRFSYKKTSKRAKGFRFTSSKIQSKKLDGIKKGDCASSSHPSFALKSYKKLLESSKGRKKDIDASVTLDSPQKQAKNSVEISKEKEKVCDVSASAGLPLEKLPLSQIVQKKLDLAEAEETSEEDGMTIAELLRSRKRRNAVGSGQLGDGETLGNLQFCSSLMADKEVTKFIDPLTASIENVTLNATVETGLETAKQDADATETGSLSHDKERFQGCESDGDQYAAEMQELQLEDRVSELERIFVELKAKRCGRKQPISPSATK